MANDTRSVSPRASVMFGSNFQLSTRTLASNGGSFEDPATWTRHIGTARPPTALRMSNRTVTVAVDPVLPLESELRLVTRSSRGALGDAPFGRLTSPLHSILK